MSRLKLGARSSLIATFMTAAAVVLIALGGCVSTKATKLDQSVARVPVNAADVVIYSKESDVPRKYDKIAMLTTRSDSI